MGDTNKATTLLIPAAAVPPTPRVGRLLAVVLALGSPALVAGAFFSDFLRYDDRLIVLDNPIAKEGFTPQALEQVARPPLEGFKGYYGQYIPLTYFTLGLQYRLHGPAAWAFRLVNLLLHFGSALLLYQIILALLPRGPEHSISEEVVNSDTPFHGRAPAIAALGTGLFFFHPTNVESVAWASERSNVQAVFLSLLSWWLLVGRGGDAVVWRRVAPPSWQRSLLALAAYAAALLSKPAAIGFAPLVVLTECFWVRGPWAGRLARSAVFAALALGAAALAVRAGRGDMQPLTGGSYEVWGLTAFTLVGRYIWHTLAPWNLSFFYGLTPVQDVAEPWVAYTALALVGALLVLAWLPVGARAPAVLVPAFALALAPTLAPNSVAYLFQDRYLYLALPAAAVLSALALEALHYRLRFLGPERGKQAENVAFLAGVLVCFLLALLTLQRSYDFRDDETLFRDAVAKQPRSFFAHFNLARTLTARGNQPNLLPERQRQLWQEAYEQVEQMHQAADVDRHPSLAVQHLLEGELAWRLGRPEALERLRQALREAEPEQRFVYAKANWIMAEMAYAEYVRTGEQGRLEERLRLLERVLEATPPTAGDRPRVRVNLAQTQELLGRRAEALESFRSVARENPELAPEAELGIRRLTQPEPLRQPVAPPPVDVPRQPEPPPPAGAPTQPEAPRQPVAQPPVDVPPQPEAPQPPQP